jgi:N-acetylglucosamine-6-sulfatase
MPRTPLPTRAALCAAVGVLFGAFGASVGAGPSAGVVTPGRASVGDNLPRPNIILIMTDDMASTDLASMPAVNSLLVKQGTRFRHALTPFSLCCPDRLTMLTGQYAHNHGVLGNDTSSFPMGGYAGFSSDSNTVATWLHDAGYQTAFVGKYLNGYGENAAPARVPAGWDEWHASRGGNYTYVKLFENGVDHIYDSVYVPDLETKIAKGIVVRRMPEGPPLFTWLSYYGPHVGIPTDADDCNNVHGLGVKSPSPAPVDRNRFANVPLPMDPSFNELDVSDKPAAIRALPRLDSVTADCLAEVHRQRLETLQSVDRGVSAIVSAVQAAGELNNTVFVFTSDNGYMIGQHRVMQGKVLPYDPSIHVPLVIRGPGFPAGVGRSKPVATQDLAPTFVDLANARAGRALDGTSLVRLAQDGAAEATRDIVLEAGPQTIGGPMTFTGLRTRKYTYVEYATGEKELYALDVDPYQLQNVAGRPAYATIEKTLAAELSRMRNCSGSGCLVETPY